MVPGRFLVNILVASCTFVIPVPATGPRPLWLSSIQPFTGEDWDAGLSMRIGAEIMVEEINSKAGLLDGYELKIAWQDGMCSKGVGTNLFLENIFEHQYTVFAEGKKLDELDADKDGKITTSDTKGFETRKEFKPVGILGPGCSGTAMNIANVAFKARFAVVSNSATRPSLSDRGTYPNFFRTILPDTFFPRAWLSVANMIGQSSVAVVIGDSNWYSMGMRLASDAQDLNVTLVGSDLSSTMPGFSGMHITSDSADAAEIVARELIGAKQRVVIFLMFAKRARLVLCESFRAGFRSAVFMAFGWFAYGWWNVEDTRCARSEVNSMVNYLITAQMLQMRVDEDTTLSCSSTMTSRQLVDEWWKRQGGNKGDTSMRPEGFAPYYDFASTADAVCMYAQALNQLTAPQITALENRTGSKDTYDNFVDTLSKVNFEGVTGRVTFAAGSADPDGTIIIQQLQADLFVDIASFKASRSQQFGFLGNAFKAHFDGEVFQAARGDSRINGALENFSPCTDNRVLNMSTNLCDKCPANKDFAQSSQSCLCVSGFRDDGQGGCEQCAAGTYTNMAGSSQCSLCVQGKFSLKGASKCEFCARSTYANQTGLGTCFSCPPRMTTRAIASEALSACVCDLGAYQDGSSCTACPANGTTSTLGTLNIQGCQCPVNMYSKKIGDSVECFKCPPGSTTKGGGHTNVRACFCEKGFYMVHGNTKCAACPSGMLCPEGSAEENQIFLSKPKESRSDQEIFMDLDHGYYASASDPMLVYVCRSEQRCPGNVSPGNACASGLVDRACEHCMTGFVWNGHSCESCKNFERSQVFFSTIIIVLVSVTIVGMYAFFGDEYQKWESWSNCVMCCAFISFNHYQIADILSGVNMAIPDLVQDTFKPYRLTNDIGVLFPLDCAGVISFNSSLILRGLCPVIAVVTAVFICLVRKKIAVTRNDSSWELNLDRMFNVLGSLLFTFFSAMSAASLMLFKCRGNPSGKTTLSADLSVLCFEEEWMNSLFLGVCLIMVYIFGVGAWMTWAIYVAPNKFDEPRFRMRYKFLFIRYRNDRYWWGVVHLLKNVLVNVVFVFALQPTDQLHLIMGVVIAYSMLVFSLYPYRLRILNMAEALACASIQVLCALLAYFAPREDATKLDVLSYSISAVSVFPILYTAICALHLYRHGKRIPFSEEARLASIADFEEVAKVLLEFAAVSPTDGGDFLLNLSKWDEQVLRHALHVIKIEACGQKVHDRLGIARNRRKQADLGILYV